MLGVVMSSVTLAGCGRPVADTAAVVDDAVAPSIAAVDRVACADSSLGERWDIALTVTDPQGADTVAEGLVSVLEARGGELSRYALACVSGACTASSRADIDGVTCEAAVTFAFTVTDGEGNVSPTVTHAP